MPPVPFGPDEPHSVSDARRNLFAIVNHVVEHDGEVVRIAARSGSAVVVSARSWRTLAESVYVFADPVNSKFVHKSIRAYMKGEPGTTLDPWSLAPDIAGLFSMFD